MMGGRMFGLFDRLGGRSRKLERAKKKELAGDLDAAVELFVAAERPDEAARVLLLKADAATDPNQRVVICAQAARIGAGSEPGEEAARRKAVLAYDLVRATQGPAMHGELIRAALELEKVGEWERAAGAYASIGDTDAEIRVLKEAGAIERLEARLAETSEAARKERSRATVLQEVRDLDAIGERLSALRVARQWLDEQADDQIQLAYDRVRGKLASGPLTVLELFGEAQRFVLGREVTIGRARADIVVASSAISRQHLRVFRDGGEPHIEDLDTRNGTLLGGARVSGALKVGDGLEVELAGRIRCRVTPTQEPDGVVIDVGGRTVRRAARTAGGVRLGDRRRSRRLRALRDAPRARRR